MPAGEPPTPSDPRKLYLDLLKKTLTCTILEEIYDPVDWPQSGLAAPVVAALKKNGLVAARREGANVRKDRENGRFVPGMADTMIGLPRLNNLQQCIEDVLARNVPGDLIETGVWRGGATIFMRAVLKAYAVTNRRVWVCDSFEGLPEANPTQFPSDAAHQSLHQDQRLAVVLERVKANFARYGLLDGQVQFVKGWFRDTLPALAKEQFAVVRLDGDYYESTMDGLNNLYPRLSPGGYLLIDDYALRGCRRAVTEYRERHAIQEPIRTVDWTGAYWQRR